MRQIMTAALTAAALTLTVAACEPAEPTDGSIAEAMPETPDISETAADEQIVREGGPVSEATGETPATEPAAEPAPAY